MQKVSYMQGVRLFFSIDLVGSTDLKNREDPILNDKKNFIKWPLIYQRFFSEVAESFMTKSRDLINNNCEDKSGCEVRIWKTNGDEILFYTSNIYPGEKASLLCNCFCDVIENYDKEYYQQDGLGVKGTIWSAGFPIRNKQIIIDPQNQPYFRVFDLNSGNFSSLMLGNSAFTDFLGPEIDLGFRLAAKAVPRRVIISLDVAVIIAHSKLDENNRVRFFHVGWETLKGVYGNVPYPIILIDILEEKKLPNPRSTFEAANKDLYSKFLNLAGLLSRKDIINLNTMHYNDTKKYRLERPYLSPEEMQTQKHLKEWDDFVKNQMEGEQ